MMKQFLKENKWDLLKIVLLCLVIVKEIKRDIKKRRRIR